MDISQLLRSLGLQQAYQAYQQNIGEPFAAVVGGAGRGYLGLDRPDYGGLLAEESYRTGQALGNMPGIGAPAGAFKAAAQIPGLLEAAGVVPAIFIGPKAKLWNKASADTFQKLEKSGVSNKNAYLQTGTFRSPDGMLRQEISDQQIDFNKAFSLSMQLPTIDQVEEARKTLVDIRDKTAKAMSSGKFSIASLREKKPELFAKEKQALDIINSYNNQQKIVGNIGDFVQHDQLFSAYPEIAKQKFAVGSSEIGSSYNPSSQTLSISSGAINPRSSAIHELQHAIQSAEGFAKGGQNIESVYPRLAGEAEARAAQARMKYSQDELRKIFPLESYDVPIDQLIVRGLLSQ